MEDTKKMQKKTGNQTISEGAVAAALAAIAFTLIVGLISRIKSKKKDMDEVSKDDKNKNSDW